MDLCISRLKKISMAYLVCSIVAVRAAEAAESMYGLFMVVKGDIKVKNLQAQINPTKVGTKIFPGETVISGVDSRAKIVMSDRNVINVSPSSEMKIEKYESAGKEGPRNVELNLIDGKVRNNVEQKYDGDKSKFLMKTPTAVAGVRGTEFLTSFNKESQVTQVVTLRGSVTLSPATPPGSAPSKISITVQKGESSSVAPGAPPEPPRKVPVEELKRIDKESSAQAAPENKEPAKTAKGNDKDKDSKSDSPADSKNDSKSDAKSDSKADSKSDAKSDPKADSKSDSIGDAKPDAKDAKNDKKGDDKRAPASDGQTPPPGSAPAMIDKRDLDSGTIVRDIRGPAMDRPPQQMLPPPALRGLPPPINPAIGDIIRDKVNKTNVIVRPVPK